MTIRDLSLIKNYLTSFEAADNSHHDESLNFFDDQHVFKDTSKC